MKHNVWFRLALIAVVVAMTLSLFACVGEEQTTEAPGGQTTESGTTDDGGDTTESKTPGGDTTESKDPDGDTTESKDPDGDTTESKDPDGDTTESKDPDGDTTETDTETPAGPTAEEKYFTVFAGAEALAGKTTGSNGNANFAPTLSEDKSYVSLHGTNSGDSNFVALNGNGETGALVVMKYRYLSANTAKPATTEIFLSCTNAGPTGGDSFQPTVIADGDWHIVIYDMSKITTANGFTANEDGTYSMKYVRWDVFEHVAPNTDIIDVAYVAMAKSVEDVFAYAKEKGDTTACVFTASKEYTEYYVEDGAEKIANVIVGPEKLETLGAVGAEGAGNGAWSAITKSEDGKYVTYAGNKNVEHFIPVLSGNTEKGTYLVFKYRYNLAEANQGVKEAEIYAGSVGANATGQGDNFRFEVIADGEWHVVIVDVAARLSAEGKTAITDNLLSYARLDFVNWEATKEESADLAYVAITSTLERALKYANVNGDATAWINNADDNKCVEYYTKNGEEKLLNVLIDAEAFYDLVKNNTKMSKVELSEDGTYVSVYGSGKEEDLEITQMMFTGMTGETGPYVVFTYRVPDTNVVDLNGKKWDVWAATTGTGPNGGEHVTLPIIDDGEWHTIILDYTKVQPAEGVLPGEDGKYNIAYIRWDILNWKAAATTDCLDVKYFGVGSDLEKVLEQAAKFNGIADYSGEKGKTAEMYTDDGTMVPAAVSISDALAAAKDTEVRISGTVVYIDTAWNADYENMSVTLRDENGAQILVYRLGANVKLGDKITVTGKIDEYQGAKQLAQGGRLYSKNGTEDVSALYTEKTVAEANAAEDGTLVKVTGVVKSISEDGKTVVLTDGTNDLNIYKMATTVAVGDKLEVTGKVGSYNGAKQLAEGATAVKLVTEPSAAATHETKGDFTSLNTTSGTTKEYIAEGDLFPYTKLVATGGSGDESISLPTGITGQYIVLVFSCVDKNGEAYKPELFLRTASGTNHQNTRVDNGAGTGWGVAVVDAAAYNVSCVVGEAYTFVRLDHNTKDTVMKVAYFGTYNDLAEAEQTADYYRTLIVAG